MNNLKLHKSLNSVFLVTVFLAVFIIHGKSQTLQRQSIASGGTYMLNDGTLIQQTVGQAYPTGAFYSNEITYRPGFQQPVFKIELIYSTISLNVFPNPATRLVTIQSSEIIINAHVQVVDMAGKLLINQQISELKTYSFYCDEWANGFYMISVSDEKNKKYSAKLVILK